MTIDPAALAASLRRLAPTDAGGGGVRASGVQEALERVVAACVELFGVSGSGFMVGDEQDVTRYVASSNGPGRVLEVLESRFGEGPCTEAFVNDRAVWTKDVATDERWPQLAGAISDHPVHAVLGVPVRMGGVVVGTLDVYRDEPWEWADSEQSALLRYAEVVEATLSSAMAAHHAGELARQLQYALDYRVVIERGVGYLMALDGVDPVTAFNRLRRSARSTRSKVGQVAQELLDSGRLRD